MTDAMTATPSLNPMDPHASTGRASGKRLYRPPPALRPASPKPARTGRSKRGMLVVCLTVLAALASAGLWLETPPPVQDVVSQLQAH